MRVSRILFTRRTMVGSTAALTSGVEGSLPREAEAEGRRSVHEQQLICSEIEQVVREELKAEVERDAKEGDVAALPPLPPDGWAVQRTPGSRFFTMQKRLDESVDGTPRLRSALEEALRRQHHRSSRMAYPAASSKQQRYMLHTSDKGSTALSPTFCRFYTDVNIYAPFQVRDLSLLDSRVPICEWACFDMCVTKSPNDVTHSSSSSLAPHQSRVWEDRTCLYLRLASANSELRVRSMQFLSLPSLRAMRSTGAFGGGDPFWKALAERTGDAGRPCDAPSTSPLRVLTNADALGEFSRGLCYQGPCMSNLSRELREALNEYIAGDLGISHQVVEYICQMQFFKEQEEYMGWLARLSHAARATASTLE